MSHDRGCFRCMDELPPRRTGCGRMDCPYRPETQQELTARVARDSERELRRQAEEKKRRMLAMG